MLERLFRVIKRILGMQIIPTAPNLGMKMRKFRFIVTNNGTDGGMRMNEQPQIAMSPSPQYLINLYAQSGDKIRILEELPADEETKNYGKLDVDKAMNDSMAAGWAASGQLGAGRMLSMDGNDEQIRALQAMQGNATAPSEQNPPTVASPKAVPVPAQTQPSYFKVGGTECKMENGKVYQKQWMRLTDDEMQNYRLISDKNNKILPMAGKHLEMLKWVITEDNANA